MLSRSSEEETEAREVIRGEGGKADKEGRERAQEASVKRRNQIVSPGVRGGVLRLPQPHFTSPSLIPAHTQRMNLLLRRPGDMRLLNHGGLGREVQRDG